MIVVNRPKRTHHRQVIRALPDVPKPIAGNQAGLSVGPVTGLERHDLFAVPMGRIASDDVLALRVEDLGERRIGDALSAVLGQGRLHIEAFDVTHSAAKEDPDYRLGPGNKMRPAIQPVARRRRFSTSGSIPKKHGAQRQTSEAHARIRQERTTRYPGTTEGTTRLVFLSSHIISWARRPVL